MWKHGGRCRGKVGYVVPKDVFKVRIFLVGFEFLRWFVAKEFEDEFFLRGESCNDRDRESLFLSIGVRPGANFGFSTGFEDLVFGRGAQHESCSPER